MNYQPKTAHNTFFLILYEMGMEDKDVRRIMGITQEAIRSTRYRILQPKGRSVARNQQNTKKWVLFIKYAKAAKCYMEWKNFMLFYANYLFIQKLFVNLTLGRR